MNYSDEKNNALLSLLLDEKSIENTEEKNINDYININFDSEELKRLIGKKIEFFKNKELIELSLHLEEKLNAFLIKQEEIFIKKEILKRKAFYFDKYLIFYCKLNNLDYKGVFDNLFI